MPAAGTGGGGSEPEYVPVDVTVRNLNILHGLFCGLDSCRLEERVALLSQFLTRGGCADIVTLQEVSAAVEEAMRQTVGTLDCGFDYEFVYERGNTFDDSIVLSRYPIASQTLTTLFPGFRHVLHVRVEHPNGMLNVFTTHLASGSDGADDPCEAGTCPDECVAAGAKTKRQCQAVELARIVDAAAPGTRIVTGDFNAIPSSFEVKQFTDNGFVDTFLAAEHNECAPGSSEGCSSGRDSELVGLESSERSQNRRIDYILVRSDLPGCAAEAAGDTDDDGIGTGPFAHEPNPFADECGPAPAPPCWVSDHDGNELDWQCTSGPAVYD